MVKNNYYIDENGDYQNAMGEEETFVALQWMNQLYQEGLILQNYDTKSRKCFCGVELMYARYRIHDNRL